MSLLDSITNVEEHTQRAKLLKGVVCAIVTQNYDDKKLGRVKVRFPWLSEDNETDWIRVAVPMAGAKRGHYFIPEIDDEVLVAFEHGDVNRPLVIGSLWNIEDTAKDDAPEKDNNIKKYTSRCGHELIFEETESEEKIQILTQGGHKIIMDDTSSKEKIEIHSNAGHHLILDDASGKEKVILKDKTGKNFMEIDSNKNSIAIESDLDISIKSTNITIEAKNQINIKASGQLIEQGALIKLN